MAKKLGQYDGSLQMFAEEAREPNRDYLLFLRWLGENGRLEHEVASQPTGPIADVIYPQAEAAAV